MDNSTKTTAKLIDILNEEQLEHIVKKAAKPGAKLLGYDFQLVNKDAGLLGDYFRLTMRVQEDSVKDINLFIKTLPHNNAPKLDMIRQNNFNTREALIYKLFEEMDDIEDTNPWRPKAYIYNDDILVLSDLSVEGYKLCPTTEYFDKNHITLTTTSMARFHAAFANYVTKKTENINKPYDFLEDYGHLMNEPTFLNSQWSQCASKLTCVFLTEFSIKFKEIAANLEDQLFNLYTKAYNDLKHYEETLNVIIHKDLWFKNILFRYSGDVATNAVLLDYQTIRFAPAAFDLMLLLYFTTNRSFRERYEREVFHHYWSIFTEFLNDDTKQRLAALNYDLDSFLIWCEKARYFAMLHAAVSYPVIMMDSDHALKTFADPETLVSFRDKDRTKPVIEYAKTNNIYRNKLLALFEEVVEKYVLQG